MEDQETRLRTEKLVEMLVNPINNFIETFILGKNSKTIRNSAINLIKGLWVWANEKSKSKIINTLISKIPYLHSYGVKAVEYFDLVTCIIKLSFKTNESDHKSSSSINVNDVFQFLTQSLSKANDLIFSHQNLELYSNLNTYVNSGRSSSSLMNDYGGYSDNPFGSKPQFSHSSNPFNERGRSPSGNSNSGICRITIFERNPCMKCYQDSSQQASIHSIADIKSSIKYNEQAQVCKLKTPMQIKEVILTITETKGKISLTFLTPSLIDYWYNYS